ncbi:Uncharacterised protein [Acinetobacter pittii]|nr:Uncharacterised protein [Acinetobacter pittii]
MRELLLSGGLEGKLCIINFHSYKLCTLLYYNGIQNLLIRFSYLLDLDSQ